MFMRRFAAAVFALVLCAPAVGAQEMEGDAEAAAKDVAIRPAWTTGMVFKFERTRETRDTDRRGIEKGHTLTTSITATVAEVKEGQEDKYVLHWRYGATKVKTLDGARNPFLDASLNLLEGATAQVVVDDLGEPKRVLNGAQLLTHAQQGIDELEVKYASTGVMANAVKQLRNQVRREQQVAGKILGEIRLLLMCSGGDYEPGKAMAYTDEVPQGFGHQFGRARVKLTIGFTLAASEPTAKQHSITFTTRVDTAHAKAALYQAYQEYAERRGLRMPKSADELGEVDFRDDAAFVLDAKTGFPRAIDHTRVIKVGGTTRRETNRLRLTSASK